MSGAGQVTGIHAVCQALPGALLTFPFGEETAVFKVGGKVFALTGADSPTHVTLKAEPADVTGLVETYAAVERGYHMNKKHWITVQVDGSLPEGLLEELVEDSYDLVVDGLPARDRP
ncbi:MmcQ/YjbR family DNA-binding protein [Aeromicrobium sp.]|uniref:MmcQ/YjbR family DNA-binding protein n=1 Tax=Aeromicrobium sp. TaxID=1871063 RepID=UPI0030C13D2B